MLVLLQLSIDFLPIMKTNIVISEQVHKVKWQLLPDEHFPNLWHLVHRMILKKQLHFMNFMAMFVVKPLARSRQYWVISDCGNVCISLSLSLSQFHLVIVYHILYTIKPQILSSFIIKKKSFKNIEKALRAISLTYFSFLVLHFFFVFYLCLRVFLFYK